MIAQPQYGSIPIPGPQYRPMPRFAANLHYLFSEVPFLDRFEAAARAGFRGVEFQVPYDHPPAELAARLKAHGLEMVLFDAPMGNWMPATAGWPRYRDGKRNSAKALCSW